MANGCGFPIGDVHWWENGLYPRFCSSTWLFTMQSSTTAPAPTAQGPCANYTVTVATDGNGTTTPAVGTHEYTEGSDASFVATEGPGSTFTRWSGCDRVTGTTCYLDDIMADKTVTATFTADGGTPTPTYTLTTLASPADGGTLSGGGSYPEAATATAPGV